MKRLQIVLPVLGFVCLLLFGVLKFSSTISSLEEDNIQLDESLKGIKGEYLKLEDDVSQLEQTENNLLSDINELKYENNMLKNKRNSLEDVVDDQKNKLTQLSAKKETEKKEIKKEEAKKKEAKKKEAKKKEVNKEEAKKEEINKKEVNKKETKKEETKKEETKVAKTSSNSSYQTFTATAYCACNKCNGKWAGQPTASGTTLTPGRTIAVDPNVIPLGSKVEIKGVGTFTAEDTGGKIKGNIIDILQGSHSDAYSWGRQTVQLRVIN